MLVYQRVTLQGVKCTCASTAFFSCEARISVNSSMPLDRKRSRTFERSWGHGNRVFATGGSSCWKVAWGWFPILNLWENGEETIQWLDKECIYDSPRSQGWVLFDSEEKAHFARQYTAQKTRESIWSTISSKVQHGSTTFEDWEIVFMVNQR